MDKLCLIVVLGFVILHVVTGEDDPCRTTNVINDWKRSVAYQTNTDHICDNYLEEGWYRVTSGAGERMPTECPLGGFRCSTDMSIYLSRDGVPDGEDIYPAVGKIVNRTTYAANFEYDCRHKSYEIQIKNCDGYYVYLLQPVSGGCPSAYCFGDQLPCPNGKSSESGFSPGCASYPDVKVTPYIKTTLLESEFEKHIGTDVPLIIVKSRATFECHADDVQDDLEYTTRWYVNDIEIKTAKLEGLSKHAIQTGLGSMLEEHWAAEFKPNMLVKCSIQVRGNGFDAPTPQQYSEIYFAGVKIHQSTNKDYVVKEGEELEIPVELTMPLSCSWLKSSTEIQINYRKKQVCLLVLLNGVPTYQTNGKQCRNGISDDGLVFNSETCGIKFSHADWREKQIVKITGQTDQLVNIKDRIVFLRLYNSDEVTPIQDLLYWKNIHLPDIKVIVKDKDVITLGSSCYSNNDPHMRTFDGKRWELQIHNGLTEGEYIMYKHTRLPLLVTAYFKKCSSRVLCNCGIGVRSADSLFVANFCDTIYRGQRKVNRYMKQRLCDDKSLIVQKTSKSYTITLPTGTKVTFNYGGSWINGISITPSILDVSLTGGLCGIYNGNQNDDFIPRSGNRPTSLRKFAASWQVKGVFADETLFDPTGKLKQAEYISQQYCTCLSPDDTYPHGSPEFNCELTTAMETCRNTKTTRGVYTTSCTTRSIRSARLTRTATPDEEEEEEGEPPSYPMITENTTSVIVEEEWTNGWTELSAKEHCIDKFQSAQAYNICSEFVSYVDKSIFINGCVSDIKSTGGDSWLKVTLNNYASACLQEAKRLEVLTVVNSTNTTGVDKPILSIIEESTCPENCSDNGICSDDGECQCFPGFHGEVCSLILSQAPRLERDAFEGLCDKRKKKCHTFVIPGSDFIADGNLTCKFTAFSLLNDGMTTIIRDGESFTNVGTYSSSMLMYCKLPGFRRKRSVDVTPTGFHISVSNNGKNYTEPLTILVYDSLCYECNITTMACEKQDSCPINIITSKPPTEPKTYLWIVIAVSLATVVVLIIVCLCCLWRHVTSKKSTKNDKETIVSNDDNL